ncbi:ATP-binding cassette domain-containing protein, partial [Poseidonocella sp. HB161398]|uniref:ATP-binding cassette domain-containing protein n=1 Tax=Poseidonocella sp. HB161398 TaxID=2320855 RepID=UPI001108FC09
MSDTILELEGVVRDFAGFRAVGGPDGLSFSLRRGGFLGLIGPNGAGKSTTFNLISGVLPPSAGRVRFDGTDISGLGVAATAALGLGRTFQTPRDFASLSVLDNVMVGLGHPAEGPLSALLGRWKSAEAG